jgi:hypothetical protein
VARYFNVQEAEPMKAQKDIASAKVYVLSAVGAIVLTIILVAFWFNEDQTVEQVAANNLAADTTVLSDRDHATGDHETVGRKAPRALVNEGEDSEAQTHGFQYLQDAFDSRAPIAPALADIAIEQDWNEHELLETAKLWRMQCEYAENIANRLSSGTLEDENLSAKHMKLRELADSCEGFGAQFGEAITKYEEGATESSEELMDHYRKLNDLREAPNKFGDEYAVEFAMDMLDRALLTGNEWIVLEVVWALIHNGLIDPPLDDAYYNQLLLSLGPVPWDVTAALMCRELGGCQGNHPIVLRQCLIDVRICHEPKDFYDVVVQVHTGLQQVAFWTVYDQITQHLARYRARNR